MITLNIVENNKPAVVVDVTKQVGAASYADLLVIRGEVAASARTAGESEVLAGQHKHAAEQSALTAGNSAQAAGESATMAGQHNTAAGQAATTATEQAGIATSKASEAEASAGAAGDSKASAMAWAQHPVDTDVPGQPAGIRSAMHHATKAAGSATLADQHQQAAGQAASTATSKASEAGASAGAAGESETKAQQWAEHPVDTDIPDELPGTRSSKHHASKAESSATLADQHRQAAEQSAQAASGSAQVAGDSATLAGQHKLAAEQAATTATEQAGIATTKANEAGASAGAAGDSKTKAQQWAEHTPGQGIPGQPVGSKSAKHWATEAQSLVESATGGSLLKANNLGDIPDKALARAKLDVPSKLEQENALALKLDSSTDAAQRAALEAALKLYADNKVAGLVNTAPETLDTLNELAAALGNDPSFATTTANLIAAKLSSDDFTAAIGTMVQPYNSGAVVDPAYVHTDNNFTTPEKEKLARLVESPEVAAIRKPGIATPVNGDTGVLRATDILSTTYYSLYGVPHENSQVQVATDNLFSSIVFDKITPGGVTSQRAEDLPHSTFLYAKVRYQDSDGIWSEWSDPVSFTTTTTYITAPTVVSPAAGAVDVPEQPVIELSAFAVTGGSDAHAATSVRIKNAAGAVVWEQTETTPLNNITVPAGVLQEGGLSYTIEPRYHGENYGASAWGEASSFTTAASFVPDGSEIGKPYGGGYVAGEIVSDYDGERYLLIVSDGGGESALKDGSSHAWKTANTAVTTAGGVPPMTLSDGRANHNALKAAGIANFPAAKWIEDNCNAAIGLNGHTDWYLPSRDELELLYRNAKPDATANNTTARYSSGFGGDGAVHGTNANAQPPSAGYSAGSPGQTATESFKAGGADAFAAETYWSSTEFDASYAWYQNFSYGYQRASHKANTYRVRAVRRVKL